ncbi:hypothetical protein M433DRAFT_185096 [Acidomyces richmondensis BFW]|nr:hypothetical protein M433DRAFT_185096 [Acidomyces richmondensis BFW]
MAKEFPKPSRGIEEIVNYIYIYLISQTVSAVVWTYRRQQWERRPVIFKDEHDNLVMSIPVITTLDDDGVLYFGSDLKAMVAQGTIPRDKIVAKIFNRENLVSASEEKEKLLKGTLSAIWQKIVLDYTGAREYEQVQLIVDLEDSEQAKKNMETVARKAMIPNPQVYFAKQFGP